MNSDGLNIVSTTTASMPELKPEETKKDQIKRLKKLQQRVWAILGLKMASDRLKSLGYDVVVQQENGCATIKIDLKVDFDFATGMIGGKDIVAVQTELKRQIETLGGKEDGEA